MDVTGALFLLILNITVYIFCIAVTKSPVCPWLYIDTCRMKYRYSTLSKTDVGALDLNLKSIHLTAVVCMSGIDKQWLPSH